MLFLGAVRVNNVKHDWLGAHCRYAGKTAVSVALSHIFGFGHTQSDNVRACKKPGPVFIRNVMGLLETHDVVIADKFVFLSISVLFFLADHLC